MHKILTAALEGTLTQETIATEGAKVAARMQVGVDRKRERLASLTPEQRAAMTREELHAYING